MLLIKKYFKSYSFSKKLYFILYYKIAKIIIKYKKKANFNEIEIEKNQILIYDPLRLGDFINCLYLIRGIKENIKFLKIVLVVRPNNKILSKLFKLEVDYIYELCPTWHGGDKNDFHFSIKNLKNKFKKTNPELIIETRGDPRDYLLLKKIFPKSILIGYCPPEIEEKINWHENINICNYYQAIFSQLIKKYQITYNNDFYKKFDIDRNEKNIVVHFGASSNLRRLPEKIAIKILERIKISSSNKIIFLETIDIFDEFTHLKKIFINDIIIKKINKLEDLFNEIKLSSVFVGTDSGPAHMASAIGVSNIKIIYGPNIPIYSIPQNNSIKIIESKKKLFCRPCNDKYCLNIQFKKCYFDININEEF